MRRTGAGSSPGPEPAPSPWGKLIDCECNGAWLLLRLMKTVEHLRGQGLLGRVGHAAPARRRQAGGLLEAAGEVALMREPAGTGDAREVLAALDQQMFGQLDLTVQEQ